MDLNFDITLGERYKSNTQKVRVMSENWLCSNMYCPCCGNPHLNKFANNRPVADAYCEKCGEIFELKSSAGAVREKIVDGEYSTMIERIQSNSNPHLFVLQYEVSRFMVFSLQLVPKFFFVPAVIEKRKPLSATARRAGWTGCNISFTGIPQQGKISVIEHGAQRPVTDVIQEYARAARLAKGDIGARGWLFDVLNCINKIAAEEFSIDDLYGFESYLQKLHPENHNIRPKIRQQLQFLRDRGYIDFLSRGQYKKVPAHIN